MTGCRRGKAPLTDTDRAAIDDFAAFLRDPSSRCSLCLQPGHTPTSCPTLTEQERTRAQR